MCCHTTAHRSTQEQAEEVQEGGKAHRVSRGQVHEGPETTQNKKFRFDNLQAKGAIRGIQRFSSHLKITPVKWKGTEKRTKWPGGQGGPSKITPELTGVKNRHINQ